MRQKPSTPASARAGFSLIELLISMTVAIILVSVAISMIFAMRRVQRFDQARTTINQNLRSATDIIGNNIRQAGQNLPRGGTPFPSITFSEDADNNTIFTIRQGISNDALAICQDLSGGNSITLAVSGSDRPECDADDEATTNTIDDVLADWRDLRVANGGEIRAYVYDPTTNNGEFVTYTGENGYKLTISGGLSGTYERDDRAEVYLLEEHRYQINNEEGSLEFILNDLGDNPQTLAFNISDFTVSATLDDNTVITELLGSGEATTEADADITTRWNKIRRVHVSLTGVEAREGPNARTFTADFLPRNVF